MKKEFISIQDAAELSKKSVQTIRRAIKAKKLQCKRHKTPQGFNYMVKRASLCELYRIKMVEEQVEKAVDEVKASSKNESVKSKAKGEASGETMTIETGDFKSFVKTMETLMMQHNDERQNFLRLVNTLQEKIFVLENQLNLLKAPAEKRWYQLWK
jgi:hypothetical protein